MVGIENHEEKQNDDGGHETGVGQKAFEHKKMFPCQHTKTEEKIVAPTFHAQIGEQHLPNSCSLNN